MPSLPDVHAPQAFRDILKRERARSDRTGDGFACILFRIEGVGGDTAASLRKFGLVLAGSVRIGDEIGWFDENGLAAVLPSTSAEGAWRFTDRVCQRLGPEEPTPVCTGAVSSGSHPEGPRPPSASNGGNSPATKREAIPTGEDRGRPVESLEPFLCRRLPVWKRTLDVTGALAGLMFLSPVFLFLAFLIKIVSPGPVFFRQERVGYMGRPFAVWKFRTMHARSDPSIHERYLHDLISNDATLTKLDSFQDSRIIPFGKFLRQSCLDELPQLLNVLIGDMSLVGPRPVLPYEAREYLPWHKRRLDAVPGMTGLWQVSGKNRTTFKKMMRLDVRYSRRISPWLDVKILLKTFFVILDQMADFGNGGKLHSRCRNTPSDLD
jgi:lipopolysaccharide/colanic/teichoic acid biosynthesis glycosyltransferase